MTGEYLSESDEQAIKIRPDLKQAIQELLIRQDGGVSLMMKSWDGNISDSRIFKERARQLIEYFKQQDKPSYIVADAKLYSQDNLANLRELPFITRMPGIIQAVS